MGFRLPFQKKPPEPSEADWEQVQGGKPRIVVEDGVTYVVHDYEGGSGARVKTNAKQLEETVTLDVEGRAVKFPTASLWRFHGQPCETRSVRRGGDRYERE